MCHPSEVFILNSLLYFKENVYTDTHALHIAQTTRTDPHTHKYTLSRRVKPANTRPEQLNYVTAGITAKLMTTKQHTFME